MLASRSQRGANQPASTPEVHSSAAAHESVKHALNFLASLIFLSSAVWFVYGRAAAAPFIFDDPVSIEENPSIMRLWPLWGTADSPGPLNPPNDMTTSGRPLVNLSLAVNYHFGHLDPIGYRVFNIILHVLSALLLMAIVRRTLCLNYFEGRFSRVSGPLAFTVALLWALHPLQTETVIYVTQRTELMVGFFYLATLYASLRYWDPNSRQAETSGWRSPQEPVWPEWPARK